MSTRSILALQKGRHVRYCFLHWDGDNHGQTLKDMLDSEIEELYNAMAPIDDGKYLFLDHLYPQSYWDGYIEANRQDWIKKRKGKSKDLKNFEFIYMRPQSTAYLPVIPTVKKGQKVELDPEEIGSYDTLATSPRSVKECLHGNREFDWCEYVWHYNLDTRVITYFTHKTEKAPWSPQTMNRRRRFTPKKFDFSYITE
jgi:hypothetical protein